MNRILIFTDQNISSRLRYVAQFIFEERMGISFEFTQKLDDFERFPEAKINYSFQKIDGAIQLIPSGLLNESALSKTDNFDFSSDLFSLTFFLLSRYEEYLPVPKDEHHRFCASQSWAWKKDCLEIPVLDVRIYDFIVLLRKHFPRMTVSKTDFNVQPTLDIDQLFLYKNKSFFRTWAASARDVLGGNFNQLLFRWQTLLNQKPDVWNCLSPLIQEMENPPILFWLLADYGKFDKNIHWKNKAFQAEIKTSAAVCEQGIHPSYASNFSPEKIKIEKERLETILNKNITKSRQHFIKVDLPQTYKNLIKYGITEDYSMGFADAVGFRAGTSYDFWWYDLEQEKTTTLRVFPFCAMDVSLRLYMKLQPKEAIDKLMFLKEQIRAVGGNFISIFHNESLSGYGEWNGWNTKEMIDLISKNQ